MKSEASDPLLCVGKKTSLLYLINGFFLDNNQDCGGELCATREFLDKKTVSCPVDLTGIHEHTFVYFVR